ncbi:response regulator [Parapedobacter sp. ISTM3]|uniref:Two component transcriptional regulator, LytTR family n=1 Tax=Parapedobacter luteus TaxID=623280 RepID=A0A1T5E0Y6_9SPHI|nr:MULTISPECIES: response regulator [Parapedobacter]MBK1440994.1 response regulator [Parapedobacter sp. ISTM3]SKB77499.1 two component transcriptional regulator, LytTR family [Parapedobacter luteus]
MKRKKILIVEDQLIITMDLEYMLEELGYQVCGVSTTYEDAIAAIKSSQPDLILVDIILSGEKTGIDLAHKINSTFHIPFIFLTSHADRSTIEAAKSTRPAGYIVKPFNRNDVYAAIEIAFNNIEAHDESANIFLPDGKHKTKIHIDEMIYAHAEGNYTTFITTNRKIVLRKCLKEVSETILNNKKFVRIHKSYLVNRDAIRARSASNILLNNGENVPLGRAYAGCLC